MKADLVPAVVTDEHPIPLRLIGYRLPHTDERCNHRPKFAAFMSAPDGYPPDLVQGRDAVCGSMRGHEGVHMMRGRDNLFWWR